MTAKRAPLLAASDLRAAITARAEALGFAVAGFANLPQDWEAADRLRAFVAAGYHGEMAWMVDTLERRVHPQNMWAGAKSAIVLGFNYGPETDPMSGLAQVDDANISVYARGDDYHELIKKKLKLLATDLVGMAGCEVKVFVDTAPLMEKPLAQLAGIGWQGKHTNLVSRQFGSWMFLGVILSDMVLPDDAPEVDHCGSCRACLDACPTDAFVAPYKLDARACLSYLTIEHRGPWPERFRGKMGNRIYGCDDCLAACPWNKFAQTAHEAKLKARDGFETLSLLELAQLNDSAFRELFSKSPIKRIGVATFLRNVNYALGNSFALSTKDFEAKITALKAHLHDDHAVVRGSAVWALAQGLSGADFAALKAAHLGLEADESVRAEWDMRHDA